MLSDFGKSNIDRGIFIEFPADGYTGFLPVGDRYIEVKPNHIKIAGKKIRKELIRYFLDRKYADKSPELARLCKQNLSQQLEVTITKYDIMYSELVERITITRRHLWAIRTGKRWPTLETLREILGVYSIDIWVFLQKCSNRLDRDVK